MTKRAERSESNQSTGGLLLVLTLLLIQHVEGQPRLCARTDFLLSSWYLDQMLGSLAALCLDCRFSQL